MSAYGSMETFCSPIATANLALSFLQAEAFASLVPISSTFVKDRFIYLNGEFHFSAFLNGTEDADALHKFFTWQTDKVFDLIPYFNVIDESEFTEPSSLSSSPGQPLKSKKLTVLYRQWDIETLQVLVPFTASMRSGGTGRIGVVILLYAGNSKWVFHNVIEPKDFEQFCVGWFESVEEAKLKFESNCNTLKKVEIGLEEDGEYWDSYDMIGQNVHMDKKNNSGEVQDDGDDDYWGSY